MVAIAEGNEDDERRCDSESQDAGGEHVADEQCGAGALEQGGGECEHDPCRSDATRTATKACACCCSLSCSQRARLECLARADTAGWRAPAFSSYAYLRGELERLAPLKDVDEKAAQVAERALDEALLALTDAARTRRRKGRFKRLPRRPHPWVTLKRFYSGSDIEHAWRAIHRAQAAAYLAYPDAELVPQAEHVGAVVEELDGHPGLLKSVTTLIAKLTDPPATARAAGTPRAQTMLRGIYERAVDVSDNLQREARGLRNALLIASATSFVVLVALGFAHVFDHEIVELCTRMANGSPEACPIGKSRHALEVFTVELAGMLGGLLSIVIPLAIGEQIKTPYRVFFQQLLLKMLVGAATALGGILLIESSVITTIKLDTTTAIIGYSVFFGFAQQVVTGAIDRRADALAKQTPIAKSV